MNDLEPHETELSGQWLESGGVVRGDAVCNRIAYLTGGPLEVLQDHPVYGAWLRIFRDKADGRLWEQTYPQSEMHGGGPPALCLVSAEYVAQNYGA